MLEFSDTKSRIAFFIEQMKKAMPLVKHHIEVYENAVKSNKLIKSPKPSPQFKND